MTPGPRAHPAAFRQPQAQSALRVRLAAQSHGCGGFRGVGGAVESRRRRPSESRHGRPTLRSQRALTAHWAGSDGHVPQLEWPGLHGPVEPGPRRPARIPTPGPRRPAGNLNVRGAGHDAETHADSDRCRTPAPPHQRHRGLPAHGQRRPCSPTFHPTHTRRPACATSPAAPPAPDSRAHVLPPPSHGMRRTCPPPGTLLSRPKKEKICWEKSRRPVRIFGEKRESFFCL